jgi:hypothetical protein
MDSFTDYVDYRWPAVFLAIALGLKLLARSKLWANPLLRAVGGLLVLAVGVCVFVTPGMIVWVNQVTGVPNISAPWVYTLLTAFSSSCLLLIIAWQRGMDRARRAVWWVAVVYAVVVVMLWVLFFLADTPVERVRDFDTYYATTPYAREMIVLYLLAHAVAGVVTSGLIWGWLASKEHEVRSWLLGGLVLLGTCYLLNLVFDTLKLTAVAARWSGRNWDWLSTEAAPSIGALSAVFGGLGFLLPHVGEAAQGRWAARANYRRLEPLHCLLKQKGALVGFPSSGRADAYLALARRNTIISDSILALAPHLDQTLWDTARREALRQGLTPQEADGVAGAAAVTAALDARTAASRHRAGDGDDADLDPKKILSGLYAVSQALRHHPTTIETARRQCAASTGSTDTRCTNPRTP